MPKQLIKWLEKFLLPLFHNIFAVIFVGIIGIPVLISWATGTLDVLLQILKSPTPLWATIALIPLCVLYMNLKENRYSQRKVPYHYPKEELISVGLFKWKVSHANGRVVNIGGLPYCIEHECSFISRNGNWGCPISGCKSILSRYDLDKVRVTASSIIENLIKNKKSANN